MAVNQYGQTDGVQQIGQRLEYYVFPDALKLTAALNEFRFYAKDIENLRGGWPVVESATGSNLIRNPEEEALLLKELSLLDFVCR